MEFKEIQNNATHVKFINVNDTTFNLLKSDFNNTMTTSEFRDEVKDACPSLVDLVVTKDEDDTYSLEVDGSPAQVHIHFNNDDSIAVCTGIKIGQWPEDE